MGVAVLILALVVSAFVGFNVSVWILIGIGALLITVEATQEFK